MRNSGVSRMRSVMWTRLPEIFHTHKNWKHIFVCSGIIEHFIILTCAQSLTVLLLLFDENNHEEDNDARIVGKPSRIVTHSVHATDEKKKERSSSFMFHWCAFKIIFRLCCYFSLYLNNIEVFCKERREAQKRRSRRPRKKNEDGMVKWKWMSFMFPSCASSLESRFLISLSLDIAHVVSASLLVYGVRSRINL